LLFVVNLLEFKRANNSFSAFFLYPMKSTLAALLLMSIGMVATLPSGTVIAQTKTSSKSSKTTKSTKSSKSSKTTAPVPTPAPLPTPAPTPAPAPTPVPAPVPVAVPVQTAPALTPDIASNGLREALNIGIQKGVEIVSKPDGFLKNPLIAIPFPQEFKMVEDGVRRIGLGSVADQAVESMNRAAEKASADALPIFLDAIKQLNFTDVMNILNGSNDRGATDFLQRTTTAQLSQKFKPIISDALTKVDATKYWGTIVDTYNKIPFTPQKVNPDLPDYVTQKSIEGLFTMVAQEEKNIRKNPAARATDVLQQVFGSIGIQKK
jgi:hypothetical protein